MREGSLLWKTLTILMSITLLFAFMAFPENAAFADSGKDYVLVIDISTSMQDIFEEVKEQAKSTIKRARVGDNVALITFGEKTTLLDRRVVRSKADIEALQAMIDDLYPTDYATYITRGLEKGLSELRYLFEKAPDRQRVMLWLSDDKDNPPDVLGEDFLTLDEVREENRNFEPGNEWFAYEAPLKEVRNRNLEEFVTWARRTTFRVVVKEPSVDLGPFEETTVKERVVLTFEPRHTGAEGQVFTAEAYLTDPNDPSQTLPVSLSPRRIVASGESWQQEFQIAFAGEPGQYEGNIRFKPVSGASLDVEPRNVPFTAMIVPPKLAAVEPEEPVEEPKPKGVLADAKDKGIIATEDRPPGLTRLDKPIDFGPLDPGKKDSKIITLFLNQEADTKGITLDSSINLPAGVDIKSEVFGSGTRVAAEITVSVDKDVQLSEDFALQEAYEGSVRFKSDVPGVEVLPVFVPIRVTFITDKVRWGRKLLPKTDIGQFKARGMTFEKMTEELEEKEKAKADKGEGGVLSFLRDVYSEMRSRFLFYVLLGAVAVLIIIMLYRMRPASELFAGELVVIKDPSESNMKNVNLKRTGSLQDKNMLTLGSSAKADIRLPHGTVSPIHCRISAKAGDNRTAIAIHPIKGFPVKVNDIELSEKNVLSDKDLIGIGDFILLFSNPEAQKEVVVHFRDGQTMKGTPVTWDINVTSFELLRTDSEGLEETAEEIAVVDFANLKAVFFLQDASGGTGGIPKERINAAEHLEVTFFDGEKVEGNPLTDYSDSAGRFYLIPGEMPNIGSILIERKSVKAITRKTQGE